MILSMVKQLNISFDDEDYEEIEKLKEDSGLNWRDFIILLTTHARDSIKKGNLTFLKGGN